MTIEECYNQLQGDYNSAKQRLRSERLMNKYLSMFPKDTSMVALDEAIRENNRQKAFDAIHTLKGVAANMCFTKLQECSSHLTEQLRDGQHDPDPELVNAVKEAYDMTLQTVLTFVKELEN